MSADIQEIKDRAQTLGGWWERARVTVVGLSIIVTLLATSWNLSATQTEIQGQNRNLSSSLELVKTELGEFRQEIRQGFADLSRKTDDNTKDIAVTVKDIAVLTDSKTSLRREIDLIAAELNYVKALFLEKRLPPPKTTP